MLYLERYPIREFLLQYDGEVAAHDVQDGVLGGGVAVGLGRRAVHLAQVEGQCNPESESRHSNIAGARLGKDCTAHSAQRLLSPLLGHG